jgi:hypothetical protein
MTLSQDQENEQAGVLVVDEPQIVGVAVLNACVVRLQAEFPQGYTNPQPLLVVS